MALVPFNRDFNRLMLIVNGAKSGNIEVSWGGKSRTYTAEELAGGVNLAEDFDVNPFSAAFAAVDQAVAKKQEFETDQIKKQFHGDAGKADMEKTVVATERARGPLVDAIRAAFVSVIHTITITQK
jgi:hypothetical protein